MSDIDFRQRDLLIDYRNKLNTALELLNDMVCQADEDTPSEYRTKHFRQCMDDCIDFINDCKQNDKVRVR
jgi:hypothetical protein